MKRQHGAALLLLLALAGAMAFAPIKWAHSRPLRSSSADRDGATLARAKSMVLGYALANGERPGELPFPDRHTDGNYDGNGDCVSTFAGITGSHLLGRWPIFAEQGCGPERPALGALPVDASGAPLWYAISRNLTRSTPVINSTLANNWLTVRDQKGHNMASDVVLVLFAPGAARAGQLRTATAPVTAWLDTAVRSGTVFSNADDDGDFTAFGLTPDSNDRLLWITRAEFFGFVTQRIARDLFKRLEFVRDTQGAYPPAADAAGACIAGATAGLYPLSPGTCGMAPPPMPAWFASDWHSVSRYVLVSGTKATVRFDGCAIVYSLSPGHLTRDQDRC